MKTSRCLRSIEIPGIENLTRYRAGVRREDSALDEIELLPLQTLYS